MTASGIDLADYQGSVDYGAADVDFAITKLTEGGSYNAGTAAANLAGFRAARKNPGTYHFAHMANSWQAEADHYLARYRALGIDPRDLRPALDAEDPNADAFSPAYCTAWCLNWCNYVARALAIPGCLFYSYGPWIDAHILNGGAALAGAGHELWIAGYSRLMPSQRAWRRVAIWQNTDSRPTRGITQQNPDGDLALVPLDELRQGAVAPKPTEVDMVCLFTHKGGWFQGVIGAWYQWVPTDGVLRWLQRHGVPVNATDGTSEVQDDVFGTMTNLGSLAKAA